MAPSLDGDKGECNLMKLMMLEWEFGITWGAVLVKEGAQQPRWIDWPHAGNRRSELSLLIQRQGPRQGCISLHKNALCDPHETISTLPSGNEDRNRAFFKAE